MPKQLNQQVNLSFTADTKGAKIALQDLQAQLIKITTKAGSTSSLGLTKEISNAVVECNKLQVALKNATSVTGALDLGQFRQELIKSNLSVEKIATTLNALGPEGQAAFAKLAQSVAAAEVPIRRTNGLLTEFATTLKNTARWQISSSILHGFMGSIQKAYGYAQDLNESLNNIRIVTGQSSDQMAEFASQANKAAKELSTTTTAYTDAALIFYQQGLTGSDVTDRTDTVIKMANVTGQSADEVSSYMTAIWNNFDDGSESLEHYADVITNLGAHTASSSKEIAEGLEKFAAIGDTVGLSYEYATTALATVVAQTRQSADTVGTAFKTLFARIQDLELGDGGSVELGKYSQALEKLGVNILDMNGEMKNMDIILNEMGAAWGTMSEKQQTALAQAVAGTRQYTQLVALMDNWDTFQKNLSYADNSEGTLQEQADIYAESWEAAQKRVKASLQEIYTQILDDDFFIGLTNGFADFIDAISNAIDALGGLKGLLPLIGTLLIQAFGNDVSNAINNTVYNIKLMSKSGQEAIYNMRSGFITSLREMADESTSLGGAQKEIYTAQANVQDKLLQKTIQLEAAHRSLTDTEQQQLAQLLDINNAIGEEYLNLAKVREQEEGITQQLQMQIAAKLKAASNSGAYTTFNSDNAFAKDMQSQFATGTIFVTQFKKAFEEAKASIVSGSKTEAQAIAEITESVRATLASFDETGVECAEFRVQLESLGSAKSMANLQIELDGLEDTIINIGGIAELAFNDIEEGLVDAGIDANIAHAAITKLQESVNNLGGTSGQIVQKSGELHANIQSINGEIDKLNGKLPTTSEQIMAIGQGIMSVSMVISSLKGVVDTISDPELSGWEKFVAILSSLGMMIPSVVMATRSLTTAFGLQTVATEGATVAQWSLNAAMDANPIGVVILALTALIGVVAGVASIIDAMTMSVEEANKELEDLSNEMKDFSSDQKSLQGNIDELEQMQDEYDKLSAKAGQYDRDIDKLTQSERDRYNEIKAKIAECNEASVAYYDEQGNAILRNNDALREQIELYKEDIELKRSAIYNDDFKDKNKAHNVKYENAQNSYDNAEEYYSSLIDPDGDWEGTGKNYEQNMIDNIQSYNWSNIQTTLNDTSSQTQATADAMQELYDIIGQGSEAILEAERNGSFEEYSKILTQAVIDTGYDGQAEYIQQYLDGIVAQAEEYQDMVDKAAGDVEKARVNAEAAANLDLSWVIGVIKYNNDNNDGYETLVNAGIQNIDAYIAAYAEGITLGVSRDANGKLISSYDDVYNAINQYEEQLFQLFNNNPNLDDNLNKAGEDFASKTFTSYQDYCYQLSEQINEFIRNNPAFNEIESEELKEQILASVFGTGNLDFDTDGFVTGLDTAYTDAITRFREQLLNKVNEGAITPGEMIAINRSDVTNLIPYDQIQNLDYIIDNLNMATVATEGWQAAVQEVIDSLNNIEQLDFSSSMNSSLTSVMSGIQSGDLNSSNITDNEDYQAMIANLEELKKQYPELAAAADMLNETWLVGTQEYSEALELVQDKMSQINLENLQEQARDASDAFKELFTKNSDGIIIDINADSEEFENAMDELLNAEYAVDVAIHTEAEQEFDSISAAMSDIKSQASLIGDDFIVAADKVRELNNTFPGILEGMEIIGDGTVRLNEQVVQSAMGMAEAEVQADAQATVDKLHNQATLLRAKQTSYENMANAALVLAQSETGTDEASAQARATISAELANLQELNSQDAAQSSMDNAEETANSSEVNGQAVANNWQSAFQAMADASYQAATIAIANMNAVEQGGEAIQGTVSVQYNGTSGVNQEASILQQTQNALETNANEDTTDWAAMAEAYAQMADQAGAAANDIEGMIAQIGATAIDVDSALGGISKGLGADNKKDKTGSEKKAKEEKKKTDEADRYHEINQAIKELDHSMNMLKKTQDHLFGGELIASLDEENNLLRQQNALYEEKNNMLRQEQTEVANSLSKYGDASDYVATFNAIRDSYNAFIAEYNSMSAEAQEAAAKQLENAKQEYDKAMKNLSRYDEITNEINSNEEKIKDQLIKQIENNLKKITTKVEIALDTTEAERKLNKFLKTMKTDIKNLYKTSTEWADVFSTAVKDSQTYLKDNQTKRDQLALYKKAYAKKDWGGENSIFVSESEALKKITDLEQELIDDSENILKLYKDAYDNLKDAFGEVADQFNDIIDEFQRIDDTLDHYEKVIELLHGGSETEQGRKELDQLYKVRKENSLATQDSLRQYIQALEARKQAALANGFDADDSYIRDIENQINEANDKLTSEIEDYIDTIQRELENSIKMAQAAMDKNIWGDTTANVRQEWDDKKAQAEGYYDTVERIYQLESLESKWKAAITSTSSLKAQQQLTELMNKQVEALESKTVLSEKDIELAEKELQVYQAQIALEDAQNNKNSMKLTRDETGNWSYQYVADESDIASKQQDYLDKINEWRTASVNAAEEIAEKTMEAYETFSERMSEIMNDVTLSEEERDAKIQALNETYWGEEGIITRLVEDSNYIQGVANRATYEELASLYLADEDNVTRMTETEQELIATMIENGVTSYSNLRDFVAGDDGKSGVYGEIKEACIETNKDSSAAWNSMAADAIGRMYKDPDSVKNTVNLAYKEMTNALSDYDKAIVASEQASGREWSKVDQQLTTTQGKIQGVWDKVDAVIQKSYELNTFEQNVLNIRDAWEKVAQATQDATRDLLTYMAYLNGASGSGRNGGGSSGGDGKASGGTTNIPSGGGTTGSTNTLDNDTAWGIATAIWTEGDSAWMNGSTRKSRITEKFGDGAYEQVQSIINAHSANNDLYNYWKNNLGGDAGNYHYSSFDTGGYTGDWSGGNGRLAMLHAKELVLNQSDTENILSAVNAIREIASLGDSISNAIAGGISNMIMNLTGLGKNNYGSYNNQTETNNGNNTFEITMNVDGGDVQEIQRAILDLPNLASQFLSKK